MTAEQASPNYEIIVRALERELQNEECELAIAMRGVGRMEESGEGSTISRAVSALDRLTQAIADHDAVVDELQRAREAQIAAFNTANNDESAR